MILYIFMSSYINSPNGSYLFSESFLYSLHLSVHFSYGFFKNVVSIHHRTLHINDRRHWWQHHVYFMLIHERNSRNLIHQVWQNIIQQIHQKQNISIEHHERQSRRSIPWFNRLDICFHSRFSKQDSRAFFVYSDDNEYQRRNQAGNRTFF